MTKSTLRSLGFYGIRIDVGMSDKGLPVLQWLKRTFGGTISRSRAQTERWRAAFAWHTFGDEAATFLRIVLPYLIIKVDQARLALRFADMIGPAPRRWTKEMRESAEAMKQELHRLNRRGPTPMEPPPKILRREIARFVDGRWVEPQGSLFREQPLDEFSGISPRSGSMRAGVVYEEPMSVSRSNAIASSCWPAPTKSDARSSGRHTTTTGVMHPGTSLTDAVRSVLRQDPEIAPHCEPGLPTTVVLNPAFVEILLGFPIEYSALRPSETLRRQYSCSKPSDDCERG